ncbi:MAG: hypothetical protein A3K76_05920 [Euryarchaeota archaeon RBG_13_57_23]|nr:MAG: hypothetical protein A3K76_05920 [Euryarchaeota archaeon RBG_13_57_23]
MKEFCAELANDQPSPGGGSASAAAGAIAASLLAMVCGITAKSKKHEADAPELRRLRLEFVALADKLTSLAREDSLAYDAVVAAMKHRTEPSESEGKRGVESALRYATEVPLETAAACAQVLDLSPQVAAMGKKSASSDMLVAVLLAEAGLKGAAANVRINTKNMEDPEFVKSSNDRLASLERSTRKLARETLDRLG